MNGKDRCFPVATVTSKPTSIKDARRAPTSQGYKQRPRPGPHTEQDDEYHIWQLQALLEECS